MLGSCPRSAALGEADQARLSALRGRITEEIGHTAARWRLTWLLPFLVLVFALLVARGESGARAIVQATTVVVVGAVFAARMLSNARTLKTVSVAIRLIFYFAVVISTASLSNPLLSPGAFMLTSQPIPRLQR